jgi:glycosyltransferase involved in cell wall biosynthesis
VNPLVSIIIPTYNRAHILGFTLESVISQTYLNWECIVVDDGSKDATDELLEFYCKADSRIKYFHRPSNRSKGANTCRNYGFEISKGKYIQWLDSDDILSENKLEAQVDKLKNKHQTTIATCSWYFFSKCITQPEAMLHSTVNQSFMDMKKFLDALAGSGGFLPSHAYLVDSALIKKAGNWREDLIINQDGEFFSRIFVLVDEIVYSKCASVFYRRNTDENISFLGNYEKAEQAVFSWTLIENTLESKFGKNLKLVSISKKYLKLRIMDQFPDIIESHNEFFNEDIILKRSVWSNIFRRIFSIN